MAGEVATKRESVRPMIDVVRQTMRDFADNGLTDKELADAKTYLTGSFPLAFSSNVEHRRPAQQLPALGLARRPI